MQPNQIVRQPSRAMRSATARNFVLQNETTTLPASPGTRGNASPWQTIVRQPIASSRARHASSACPVGSRVMPSPNRRHSFTVCHSSVLAPPIAEG